MDRVPARKAHAGDDARDRTLLSSPPDGPARRDQERGAPEPATGRMNATPSQHYAAGVAAGRWQADPMQQAVLPLLDAIACELRKQRGIGNGLARLFGNTAAPAVRGLYLWGGEIGRAACRERGLKYV